MIPAQPIITGHAAKRVEERFGITEGITDLVYDALHEGMKHTETEGELKEYFQNTYDKSKKQNKGKSCNMRLYKNFIFIFIGCTLVTMYGLPTHLISLI